MWVPHSLGVKNDGPGTWSAYNVVGHLIHGERTDWIPRARRILAEGTRVPFDRFDREAQFRESQGKPIRALVEEFKFLRAKNLDELKGMALHPTDMSRRGTTRIWGK